MKSKEKERKKVHSRSQMKISSVCNAALVAHAQEFILNMVEARKRDSP